MKVVERIVYEDTLMKPVKIIPDCKGYKFIYTKRLIAGTKITACLELREVNLKKKTYVL
jgi:hypothetical protein